MPLSAVADVQLSVGPAEVRRVGQERVAVVSANLAHGDLGAAIDRLKAIVAEVQLPVGTTAFLSGQSEEMQSSFQSLQFVLLLAVFLVYLVMASQFESLMHPFVILLTIPLAVTGAVWALWLTGTTVNVVAYIGVIMLAGIVVNQSIVLIDAVNQARERGLAKHEAILEAGRLRLRPILITKLTTILGLLPMALGLGEGAEVRAPMAITVIGGVLLTTFLTLLVIPVVYAVLDRKTYVPRGSAAQSAAEAGGRLRTRHAPHGVRARTARHHGDDRARRAGGRPDLRPAAAARGHAGHHVPRHAGRDPLPRLDARGDGAAGGAAGRGGARDAVGHRGDPCAARSPTRRSSTSSSTGTATSTPRPSRCAPSSTRSARSCRRARTAC